MRGRLTCWTAAALVVLFTLVACSGPGNVRTEPRSESSADTTNDLEALFWARQDSARMSFTEADIHFMMGMIGHHAQALVMSGLAPTHGASEQVQRLAARIINSQEDEIASMQQWLRERGQPVPEVHIEGLHLMVHGGGEHDHTHMPGMLTQEQIQALDEVRGQEFDRLFLLYMIQHHNGAITMVDELFGTDGAVQDEAAFKLAADMHVDQSTEVARMNHMLDMLIRGIQDP